MTHEPQLAREGHEGVEYGLIFRPLKALPVFQYMYLALTLNVFALGDDGEDGLRAALVAEVVVPALPRPVPEEGEAAREEERVGPRLAPPRQPLALRGHRQVRPGPEQRRPPRRGRTEDALARLAVVDLKVSVEMKSLLWILTHN